MKTIYGFIIRAVLTLLLELSLTVIKFKEEKTAAGNSRIIYKDLTVCDLIEKRSYLIRSPLMFRGLVSDITMQFPLLEFS